PPTRTDPERSPVSVVVRTPARARRRVDLPEPLGPASNTCEPASMCRLTSASTGSRRPKGRQVRSRTSTETPSAVAGPPTDTPSDRVRLTDFPTRREGVQRACPGQPANQSPAPDPGDDAAGDHAATQEDDLPRRGEIGDVVVPLVEDDLEHCRKDATEHGHDHAEAAVPEQGHRELDTQALQHRGHQDSG